MIDRFVTFGSHERFMRGANTLAEQAKSSGWFKTAIVETAETLASTASELWCANEKFISTSPRGYGYWLWKPIMILSHLNTMNDGDTLCYADAGCTITPDEKKNEYMLEILNSIDSDNFIVTGWANQRVQYVKKDLLLHFGINNKQSKRQRAATSIIIMKNEQSCKFVSEWIDIGMMDNYHFIDDSPSVAENFPEFIEHRHDQAILDLLCDHYNIKYDQKYQTQGLINFSRTTPTWRGNKGYV